MLMRGWTRKLAIDPDWSFSCKRQYFFLCRSGQRLAAQKGESEDLVGAMRANETAESDVNSSDEE